MRVKTLMVALVLAALAGAVAWALESAPSNTVGYFTFELDVGP